MGRENFSDKEAQRCDWQTPPELLQPIRKYFGGPIPLDPATAPDNPTEALLFYTEENNGLAQEWNSPWFCNPPFSTGLKDWLKKFHEESVTYGRPGIAVLPCGSGRPGTRYYYDHFWGCDEIDIICWVKGRISFLLPDGTPGPRNNYPTKIVGYCVEDPGHFVSCFGHLGRCTGITLLD